MTTYAELLGPRRAPPGQRHAETQTSQRVALRGRAEEMARNAAGGYTFTLDDWTTLRRFLILGTTQGTYYASAEELGADALQVVDRALAADPIKFVDTVVEISEAGAPLKQSPCLFALARACSITTGDQARDTNNKDPVTVGRSYALAQAPRVLRTYQHVFEFLDYCRRQRGAGSGLRSMLQRLVLDKSTRDVEYQALKYRGRVGWTPRDMLRYAHPKTTDPERDNLLAWIVKPESDKGRAAVASSTRLAAFEELRADGIAVDRAVRLITDERLTHEFVPNELLGERDVWAALLPNLPLTALVRNLRKMTQVELLVDGGDAVLTLREKLVNAENLKRARVHPLRVMMADRQYRSGTSRYGHGGDFTPSGEVLNVLEDALELSWSTVEPLNRSVLVAVDDSGSMGQASGAAELSAFEAGLALAMWYRRTERRCQLVSFTDRGSTREINVSPRATWNELVNSIRREARGTDCAEPIAWLNRKRGDAEVIVEITDGESWSGPTHTAEELGRLRQRVGHPVAFVAAAVTATKGTIADPKDPHSLNVVGFDPTVPEAIAAHVKEVFRE